ncbi:MAG TPA: FAD-dependent oxidoreductase, partial [Polyangiaceae bacterium]|nr:FAD-dependent oxidoreductase [Polyangiaceae bacterium]
MKAKKELVIVGNGMATCRLLDGLHSRDAQDRFAITVIGDEAHGAYNRIQLGKVLVGGAIDDVLTKPSQWYAEHGVKFMPGRLVEKLDTAARRVHFVDGEPLRYDAVVLATGSKPILPALNGMVDDEGKLLEGIFGYRTLDDSLSMRRYARPGDSAVVLGGGLLGLEAAKALSDLGLHVTIVHLAHQLMNTQLDFVGGEMLRKQIERGGMFVRTGRTIERVLGTESRDGLSLDGVVLDDGEQLSADMLVVACGVRPRIEVAQRSRIPVNRGIQVNDLMATEVPGVYAIGECTEHCGMTYGLVAPAWEQADVLADVLTGARPQARYHGSKLYSRLKVAGVEVASLGVLEPVLESDQVIQIIEERSLAYRKLIVRGRQLIGAQLVGNTAAASALIQTFDRDDPLPEDPLEALCSFSAGGAASSGPRTIC